MAAFQRIACLKVSLVTNFTGHVTECFGSVNLTAKSFNLLPADEGSQIYCIHL